MTNFKAGDIFTFQLPNQQYGFGRILLDVSRQCIEPNFIDKSSSLDFFAGCILVELYKQISDKPVLTNLEIIIPGIYCMEDELDSMWTIVGHEKIDPLQVDFPEYLSRYNVRDCFEKGEVRLFFPKKALRYPNRTIVKRLGIRPNFGGAGGLPYICLYYSNLKHLITPMSPEAYNLTDSDLRLSPHRSKIYKMLEEDENQSYSEMSSKLGLDISRFYE